MTDQSLSAVILKELAGLPEKQQAEVLTFVRFLKIGLADPETTRQAFGNALTQARKISEANNITQDAIDREIKKYRTGN